MLNLWFRLLSVSQNAALSAIIFEDGGISGRNASLASPDGSPHHIVTSSTSPQKKPLIGSRFKSKSDRQLGCRSPTQKRDQSPTSKFRSSCRGMFCGGVLCAGVKKKKSVLQKLCPCQICCRNFRCVRTAGLESFVAPDALCDNMGHHKMLKKKIECVFFSFRPF